MDADPVVRNLLFLYAGAMLINVAVSAALYARDRDPLYRSLLVAWASMVLSYVAQGALSSGDLPIVVGFSTAFLVNLAFARLLGAATDTPVPWRPFAVGLAGALLASVVVHAAGGGFTAIALPTAVAAAMPSLVTAARVIRARRALSTSRAVLLAGCVLFSLHNLDFAFLRDRPEMAPLGFTLAMLVVFGLSTAGPAVALERVTERHVRLSTELDVARRIQAHILPRDQVLPGLEMACHVRPAESVGGDYLDAYEANDRCWFLLGDVTGHGLGAGLVALMVQSTMSSLLRARPDISPRELNFLANRVLADNLARLQERRHLTVVSLLRLPDNRFVVSGSHDGLLIWRAADRRVESVATNHFPVGLGYLADLGADDFREEPFALSPGDVLFLFTDGVTEAARGGDPRKGIFGLGPVEEVLETHARAPLAELRAALLARLEAFTGGAYHDDVAFLVVRATAEAA